MTVQEIRAKLLEARYRGDLEEANRLARLLADVANRALAERPATRVLEERTWR